MDELHTYIFGNEFLHSVFETAADHLKAKDPAHRIDHALRVSLWTIRLASNAEEVDDCIIAGLLHDIGNHMKGSFHSIESISQSTSIALGILNRKGLSIHRIERIIDAIKNHGYTNPGKPVTPLAQALHDADLLDAVGMIGIARMFSVGATLGADLLSFLEPIPIKRETEDQTFTLDHCFTKLLLIPQRMLTQRGREEALARVDRVNSYLCDVVYEVAAKEELNGSMSCPEKRRSA
jgi:uncharacterized protein